ncbi:FMN-binding negative transcriptional regulator [Aquitalea magnusonii]|uniref:FMN-binding negative transcriptional regulator n=1 Tax=Aquitalea magnusonii TaxID=332411 RepID=UPI0007505A77|nr:FMN-binding negative transcriptional regulator [Aquitalea magnusonii]
MSLYCPAAFAADADYARQVMADNPLATLITQGAGEPWLSHVVLLPDPCEADCLLGHLARANGHAAVLFGQDSVAVFTGAHGYVSPRWYESDGMVPTWNYRVAHAHGRAEAVEGEALSALLQQLALQFEGAAAGTAAHCRRRLWPPCSAALSASGCACSAGMSRPSSAKTACRRTGKA